MNCVKSYNSLVILHPNRLPKMRKKFFLLTTMMTVYLMSGAQIRDVSWDAYSLTTARFAKFENIRKRK